MTPLMTPPMTTPMRRSGFALVFRAMTLSVMLTGAAMLLYPGGTSHDRTRIGYSLTQNFLSDLGMTVAYNGAPNRAGAACFVAGLCVLVLGLGSGLVGFVRAYAVTPPARRLAIASVIVGALVCIAFVGIAFTPENSAMGWHLRFTFLGFYVLPLVGALVAATAWASHRTSRRVVLLWAALSVVLAMYAALLAWGPGLDAPQGLTTYVIAQKLVAAVVILVIGYQAVLARRNHMAT